MIQILYVYIYVIIQIKNIPAICESIILFDVLHKRKVCIDAIAEGLERFRIKAAISLFPEIFKNLFTKQECAHLSHEIINCLNFGSCGLRDKESVIEELIKKAIERMNNSGMYHLFVAH